MEIIDKDFKNRFVAAFQYGVKVKSYYLHKSFLETCKSYGFCPAYLNILKKAILWIWKWRFYYILERDFVEGWEWSTE